MTALPTSMSHPQDSDQPAVAIMYLIAAHDIAADAAAAALFLCRLRPPSVSVAADMIAGATVTGRRITILTTADRTYKYTY